MASINGREYQLATSVWTVIGSSSVYVLSSIRDFTYKVAAPKEPVRSQKGEQVGFTIKEENTDGAKVRLLQSELRLFLTWLRQQFPTVGVGQIAFDVSVLYGSTAAVYQQDKLDNVMINELAFAANNDQNALEVDLPLFVLKVHPAGGDFVNYNA